ncbi:uncharacterized protein [Tenebrio molitor]|uniref:uncharacterized protein isoform X1 n=1 Tax=Tenebrio molitor TaxID=7067 RepID=UPI0036246C67
MFYKNVVKALVLFVKILTSYTQKTGYCESCNSTEECADHRYECRLPDNQHNETCFVSEETNALRCFCDRFHSWGGDSAGCVQLYNASEIMNMTEISVTDNIRNLDEEVNEMMKTQIAAGVFVFGMVIVASLTVTIFCIYTHVKDKFSPKRAPSGGRSHKNAEAGDVFLPFRPSTSTTLV